MLQLTMRFRDTSVSVSRSYLVQQDGIFGGVRLLNGFDAGKLLFADVVETREILDVFEFLRQFHHFQHLLRHFPMVGGEWDRFRRDEAWRGVA